MHKPKIEIGISALNEAKSIERLLHTIKDQEQSTYQITRVTVISDGSTDETVLIAKSTDLPNLMVIDSPERLGKSKRVTELVLNCEQDILVLIDADVSLGDRHALSRLVQPLLDSSATLTAGRPVKINTKRFTDRIMDVSQYMQDAVKAGIKNGHNVYACHGRLLALHREFFRTLDLPMSSVGNDAYLYFDNEKNGNGFAFVSDSIAYYKMPQSFHDFAKQQRRFSSTPNEQARIFGMKVLSEYRIPMRLKIDVITSALLKYHVYFLGYVIYRLAVRFIRIDNKATWQVSESTKGI